MSIKVSKQIVSRIAKIQKNREESDRYAKEVHDYFAKREEEFQEHEYLNASIVKGEIIEEKGKTLLKIDGFMKAKSNSDGTFCRQVTRGEDWYSGEYYIPIGDDQFIQIHYDM